VIDTGALERALAECTAFQADGHQIKDVDDICRLGKAVLRLRTSLLTSDWAGAAEVIQQTTSEGIRNAELAAVADSLALRKTLVEVKAALTAALADVHFVEWQHELFETKQLAGAIAGAEKCAWLPEQSGMLLRQAQILLATREGWRSGDRARVQAAVQSASVLQFEHDEIREAQRKLAYLGAVEGCVDSLRQALRSTRNDVLETQLASILHEASELHMIPGYKPWQQVKDAPSILADTTELCTKLTASSAAVQHALETMVPAVVEKALEGAAAVEHTSEAVQMLRKRYAWMTIAQQNLSSALASGMQRGWERESIETQPLAEAIEQARQLPANSAEGKVLLQKAEAIYALRIGLKRDDWDGVERAVEAAGQLDVGRSEVQAAREKLTHRAEVVHCLQELQRAIAAVDEHALRAALQEAYRLGMADGPSRFSDLADDMQSLVAEGSALVAKIAHIMEEVNQATMGVYVQLHKV
jgi:FtsZ-binding cell division protein ZapB